MEDCFIICPLGDPESKIRDDADRLLKHILNPVLKQNKYKSIRADQIPEVGLITTQIIKLIADSPLLIADLTGSNPNVFYELAIRHSSGLPYIQMVKKGEKIPFDISGIRTIEFDLTDLDDVENAKLKLDKHIRSIKKGYKPESPVSIAMSTKLLQDDEEFVERIAGNLNMLISEWNSYYQDSYYFDEDTTFLIKKIYNKLWPFSEFGIVSMEDIDKKLNQILEKLEKSK